MKKRSYELPAGLTTEQRKVQGSFYTPEPVVDFMVEQALKNTPWPLKILDPACGAGAFPLGILRYVRKHAPEQLEAYAQNIHLFDCDKAALELARKRLPEIPAENFLCTDALTLPLPRKPDFDLVIGNPPYRCGGLRGNAGFPEGVKTRLKAKFPLGFEYKMNLFALFIELAMRRGERGCLIVPDSLLAGRYFSKIRAGLLKHFALDGLFLLEGDTFDASVGAAVICHFHKGTPQKCTTARFSNTEDLHKKDFFQLDQKEFSRNSRSRFLLTFSETEHKLAEKLSRSGNPLGAEFHFSSGLIAKNGKDSIVAKKSLPGFLPGIVYGREIHPFELCREGFYLNPAPEKIKSGLPSFRSGVPQILLRQTGSTLVAAYDDSGIPALNNCHIGRSKGKIPEETAVALLNSKLLRYRYHQLSMEHHRELAQIDIDLLNELPLRTTPEFDAFAEKCRNSSKFRHQLDRQVYALYALTQTEIEEIERQIR